jgi:hypothetical protein
LSRHAAIPCHESGKLLPLPRLSRNFDQTTYMSINPVSRSLLPHYGPLAAANSSPDARAAAVADKAPEAAALRKTVAPATSSNSDSLEAAESSLERALRQTRIATGVATSVEPNAAGTYAPAIGLYRRVSQYSDDRSSESGLLKSWNDIVRENRFEETGMAGYVKAVAQNDSVALPTRVLHLTV